MPLKFEKLPPWLRFPVEVGRNFARHRSAQMAAAIAFYTLFALGPVLLIAVSVAGLIVGRDEVRAELLDGLRSSVSADAMRQIETVLRNATLPGGGIIATVIGTVTLVIAATGAFHQLRVALNTIFEVESRNGRPVWEVLKARLVSFSMVLSIGAVLLGSMLATAAISAIGAWADEWLPMPEGWLQFVNALASFVAMTAMFALMFKVLPDGPIRWRHVWFGAAVTSILFAVGRHAIGIYLGRSSTTSVYGAAGSVVALLLWVYYSAIIFLVGAEITHVRMKWAGVRPKEGAAAATRGD